MEKELQTVLKTIVYFDIFDYPLTLMELFKWLKVEPNENLTINQLSQLIELLNQLGDKVEQHDGFIFLKGRSEIINLRLNRYNIAEEKFKHAGRFIKLLRFIPYIKCIVVCNRLGYGNVWEESDIDLAVIVPKNRLWLSRLLSVGLLDLLKVRPKQIERPLAIDLNFFISQENFNLENLIFDEAFVFPYWLSQIIPVYDHEIFAKFITGNGWLKKYLPNFLPYELITRRQVKDNWLSKIIRFKIKLLTNFDFLEKWSERYQRRVMPLELKDKINQDSRVIINQDILKFHQSENWHKLKITLAERVAELNLN